VGYLPPPEMTEHKLLCPGKRQVYNQTSSGKSNPTHPKEKAIISSRRSKEKKKKTHNSYIS
jgi:hypothetical protein